ncbi:MAG: potassium transporter TrkG [Oscillospiraceae bacterium]|nr:potassium transporter TrkG [Oscillospiraceae bacterium]
MHERKINLTSAQILALGFMVVILAGSFLLSCPFSARDGQWTNYLTCLFTSVSATCVTGLVVTDTFTHWTFCGQLVILLLIQVGGLGFMTVITMFALMMRKKLAMHERRLLMQSAGTLRLSGVVRTIKRILIGTMICELCGASVLALRFSQDMPARVAIWYGLFHAVSAFCNAGFDLMGRFGAASFTTYVGDPTVNLTIMALIVVGGLGFLVWDDLLRHGFRVSKCELHTKIVLTTTGILIFGGAMLFYLTERRAAFSGLTAWQRVLASLFQSVTTRTAGFNTVDEAALSQSGGLISVLLMFVGGSPGSTAGGIKTVTFAVLVVSTLRCARNESSVVMFRRKIEPDTVRQAGAVASMYLAGVILAVLIICAIEPISLLQALFESVSAIGTVGLSMGVTQTLGTVSRLVLIFLMYAGRIGGLTLALALAEKRNRVPLERPVEKILIG